MHKTFISAIRVVATCLAGHLLIAQSASAVVLGINAGVSTRDTPAETVAKYKPAVTILSRATGEPVELVPVRSDQVNAAIAEKSADVLIVHTHVATSEAVKRGWKVAALSSDTTDNQIYFLIAKGDAAKAITEVKNKMIVFPGNTSFASVAARAEVAVLAGDKADFKSRTTAYQDSLPFYLTNGFAGVGVTRLSKVAKQWETEGGRVLHTSRALPVYAVIYNPSGANAVAAKRLADALIALDNAEFTKASKITKFAPADGANTESWGRYFASGMAKK